MNVTIKVIPHKKQRYETCGDWFFDSKKNLQIRVSKLNDWRQEMLIAIHELVEVLMCKQQGITQRQVDTFDIDFEKYRPEGDDSEPGDDSNCPYRRQHFMATNIEALLCAALDVNWQEYEKKLSKL